MNVRYIVATLGILLSSEVVNAQNYTTINITKADFLQSSGAAEPISPVGAQITFEKNTSTRPSTFSIYALSDIVTHITNRPELSWRLSTRSIKAGLTTSDGAMRHTILASGMGSNLVNESNATFPEGTKFGLWFSIPNFSNYAWYKQRYGMNVFLYDMNSNGGRLVPNRTMPVAIDVPLLSEMTDSDWAPVWDVYVNGSADYLSGLDVKHSEIKTVLHTIDFSTILRATAPVFVAKSLDNMNIEPVPINVATYHMGTGSVILHMDNPTILRTKNISPGNKSLLGQESLAISSARMKQYFRKPGIYTVPIELIFKDSYTGDITKKYSRVLNIHVPNLSSFSVSTTQIDLKLESVNDYQQGVSKEYPDHLVVSQLQPYTISVKANSTHFTSVDSELSIPVSAIQLGPATGQNTAGFNTVNLSTSPQLFITGNDEIAIDKKYGIKYSIPSNEAKNILSTLPIGATVGGVYTGTITYTLTPQ
ncbi:hypothetical protein OHD16_19800 [Sphingobacterium sp. ML3W]|uniref:hypothetical protein n=1 Tax=unclassified Sphingobacterium TaxID=2609468 RepID=UPI001CBBBCBC|nr:MULTISPECIES: hypothetical protein [unclassified Sphingobacterium]WFA82204.1 hypothetical protein OGI71_12940 [Sphingobacterium sp. ML3W]